VIEALETPCEYTVSDSRPSDREEVAAQQGFLVRVLGSGRRQKVVTNVVWQSGDKVIRMGLGVVVGIMVTRHLGPERFGVLAYSIAFSGMFSSVASLGFDGIVVREVSKDPTAKDLVLATAFQARLLSSVSAFVLLLVAIFAVKGSDFQALLLTAIVGISLFFSAWDVYDLWFQSELKPKYTVVAKGIAFSVASVVKLMMVALNAPLVAFALSVPFEGALSAFNLRFAYRAEGYRLRLVRASWGFGKKLLLESWPLIVAGLATFTYMRIGQIMLGDMLGNVPLGIYSAAVRLSEMWYFIPVSISASVFPVVVGYWRDDREKFDKAFAKLCTLMFALACLIAVIMTFGSQQLVRLLYGSRFDGSGTILAIHIWAGIFVFIGICGSIWTTIHGYQKVALLVTVLGAIANVCLNMVLIPSYGGLGAAYSAVVSYAVAGYLSYFLFRTTRPLAVTLTKAVFLPWRSLRSH
jgi:PST family polysaccharide transporter